MQILNYLSNLIIPAIMISILFMGIKEKTNIFDSFLSGVKEGMDITVKIFPTLLGFFIAIGTLKNSGALEIVIKTLSPLTAIFRIPRELMPLMILRPVSR